MSQETPDGVSLRDLTVAYERHPAVHHVSGRFVRGSLTAIVGPNGAGKSTLLKTMAGVTRASSGTLEGLAEKRVAYLPQQSEIERDFPITVGDAVLFGRWRALGWHRGAAEPDRHAVADALDAVGLATFASRYVGTLSAGQFQRMLFARLMLVDADLVLLDEPFTALDQRTTEALVGVVERWHQEGRTIVAVLHDFEQVRRHFPQTLLLARELVAWGPTADTLTDANLARARRMAEEWDEHARPCDIGEDAA